MVWKNQYYEDDILSKAAYRSNLIPIKFLILYFTGKTTLQFLKHKSLQIIKEILFKS